MQGRDGPAAKRVIFYYVFSAFCLSIINPTVSTKKLRPNDLAKESEWQVLDDSSKIGCRGASRSGLDPGERLKHFPSSGGFAQDPNPTAPRRGVSQLASQVDGSMRVSPNVSDRSSLVLALDGACLQ